MKYDIQPVTLPLGLGVCDKIEVIVSYSIGDPTTDLIVKLFKGNVELLSSPFLLAVPDHQMRAWDINLAQVLQWTSEQVGAVLIAPEPENQS